MPLFTLAHLWSWLPQTTSMAAKSAAEKVDGLPAQVVALKHAPPPWRKIISLSEPELGLTAMPVEEPSRHLASANGTQVHFSGCRPVMMAEFVLLVSWPQASAKGTNTIVSMLLFNMRQSSNAVERFGSSTCELQEDGPSPTRRAPTAKTCFAGNGVACPKGMASLGTSRASFRTGNTAGARRCHRDPAGRCGRSST